MNFQDLLWETYLEEQFYEEFSALTESQKKDVISDMENKGYDMFQVQRIISKGAL